MLKEIKYAFESDFAIEVRLKMPKQTCHSFQSPCLQICNWSVTSTKVVLFHKVLIVVYFFLFVLVYLFFNCLSECSLLCHFIVIKMFLVKYRVIFVHHGNQILSILLNCVLLRHTSYKFQTKLQ